MEPLAALEGRVATLERSLRRARFATLVLGLAAVLTAATALTTQSLTPEQFRALQDAQSPEMLATQRLVLTNELGVEQIGLVAGTDGSLVVLDSEGDVVVRLGGSPVRPVEH
jgi:hypothetical protein